MNAGRVASAALIVIAGVLGFVGAVLVDAVSRWRRGRRSR